MNGFAQLWRTSPDGSPAALQGMDLLPVLLFLLVVGILAVGMFFVWLSRRHVNTHRPSDAEHDPLFHATGETPGAHPFLFDAPTRWLAIRSDDLESVQAALNLHNPTRCSWEEGMAHARDRRLFISPPIGEWVLVVGSGLPDPAEDVDACFRFLHAVSRKLGHVQFFSANRVLAQHAWARLDDGRVQRAYAWAGQTLWNQGRMTLTEMDLNLKCLGYGEPATRMDFAQNDPLAVNTEKVAALAARWSVDPAAIDERRLRSAHGITGDLSSRSF